MNLTTAFLFLFIVIVIPGLIFLRIFFYGEFSKQFTTKENIPRLLLLSTIPGLLISASYLPIYNWFAKRDAELDSILILFEKLSGSQVNEDKQSLIYFKNYGGFINYCFWEYVMAATLAFLLSRVIVRGAKLDRKWKTLRFKNQWYYVFSGEVFEIKKFEKASRVLLRDHSKTKEILLARADILIKGAEGSELYSGYVADYDLNPGDISKLDNLYLIDAVRYKTVALENGEANVKNPERVEKKLIPGELFVLNMATMININVSYVLLLQKKDTGKISGIVTQRFNLVIKLFSILLLISTIFIFYNPGWIKLSSFEVFHRVSNWYHKISVLLFCTNFTALINPTYDNENKLYRYLKSDLRIGGTLPFYSL